MKILFINPYFYPYISGIEKVVYSHAIHLIQRGYEVHVITSKLAYPKGKLDPIPTEEELDGIRIHRLNVILRSPPGFSYPSNGGIVIQGLKAKIREINPHIVHAHNIGAPAWAMAGALYVQESLNQGQNTKFFYSPHFHPSRFSGSAWDNLRPGIQFISFHKIFFYKLNYLAIKISKKILMLTSVEAKPLQDEFNHLRSEQLAILPNGINPSQGIDHIFLEKHFDSTSTNLLFVGKVDDPRKGFGILINAMREIWSKFQMQSIELTIIGLISPKTKNKILSEFQNKTRILGVVNETQLSQEYRRSHIFVMPSLYEGFGIPYLEAMSYGSVPIGTNIGGSPFVIKEGTGILVSPGSVQELISSLIELIEYPQIRLKYSEKGLDWSKQFHWNKIVDSLENYYNE